MRILVTGAAGGIGKEICLKFLKEGHEVLGMDILPSEIKDAAYTHIIHDIADKNYPAIADIEVLVNSAGVMTESAEDIAFNLTAIVELTEHYAFQDHIRAVVNISSASALTGSEFPHYAASKGGLSTYTKNLAIRLAKYKATANSLCPGAVLTDFNRHILESEDLFRAVTEESLLKKWAEPEEIAEWTYFLACVNRSMTGENLLIDNGEALNYHFIW